MAARRNPVRVPHCSRGAALLHLPAPVPSQRRDVRRCWPGGAGPGNVAPGADPRPLTPPTVGALGGHLEGRYPVVDWVTGAVVTVALAVAVRLVAALADVEVLVPDRSGGDPVPLEFAPIVVVTLGAFVLADRRPCWSSTACSATGRDAWRAGSGLLVLGPLVRPGPAGRPPGTARCSSSRCCTSSSPSGSCARSSAGDVRWWPRSGAVADRSGRPHPANVAVIRPPRLLTRQPSPRSTERDT
jgi:hypothetical protein